MTSEMPRKKRTGSAFGGRLVAFRKARGFTQVQLAKTIGTTQRAISYYENEADYPPAGVIVDLARGLRVSADELLGLKRPVKALRHDPDPEIRRLWKKVRQIQGLPERDQRAVIRLINSLAATRGNGRR